LALQGYGGDFSVDKVDIYRKNVPCLKKCRKKVYIRPSGHLKVCEKRGISGVST
jgi:hypothetical protein